MAPTIDAQSMAVKRKVASSETASLSYYASIVLVSTAVPYSMVPDIVS
jgi:hypothetical protein